MTTISTAATGDEVRPVTIETRLAAEIKRLLADDQRARAAERFCEIVDRQQRRASRIAYHYLRDPAEVEQPPPPVPVVFATKYSGHGIVRQLGSAVPTPKVW